MKSIALNSQNDIYTVNGNLQIATGKDAIASACQTAIRTLRGELQYNVDFGIPYFDVLYTSAPNLDMFRHYILSTAQDTDGVNAIKSLDFQINGEVLKYELVIKTGEGEATING